MMWWYAYMEVSIKGGTPKSSILVGFSITNYPLESAPIYGTHHMAPISFFSTKKLLNLNHPSSYPRLDTQPQMNRFSNYTRVSLGRYLCINI